MSGDTSRGSAEIDGFIVAIDELERFQILLNDSAETHARAGRAELHGDAVGAQSSGTRGVDRAGVPVPGWHDELDRRWTDQRASMICALDEAARSLAEVARSYLAQDAHVADILSADTASVQTHPRPDQPGAPERPAGDGQRFSNFAAEITRVEHAVGVWAQRGSASDETARLLRASLDNLAWRGSAATAFHGWMSLHLRRWVQLARSADVIAGHLVDDARRDDPHDPGPDVPELTTASSRAPRPSDDLPVAMPPPGPSGDGDHPAEMGPEPAVHPRPAVDAPSPNPPLDHVSPAHPDTSAGVSEPARSLRASDGHDGTELAAESADDVPRPGHPAVSPDSPAAGAHHPSPLSTAPDPARTQISDPQPGHDTLDSGPLHETTPREPSAPDPPAPPVGAVAGAAALARQDRAHYIVRDITMPPPAAAPTTPPQPDAATLPAPRGTGNPATPPDPGTLPQHPAPPWPAAGRPTGSATPAPMPPGPDTALIGADPHPAAGRIPQQRRAPGNAPIWVNLNPPGPPAWIDLTARPGLGFDGPGATDILRTAIAELHQHTPAALVIPEPQLADLLRGPGSPTRPRTTTVPGGRLRLVDHPYDGLQELRARTENHPRDAAPTRLPRVLVAPAPTTHQAFDDLATALQNARAYHAAALLLGPWPYGARLTIDAAHHVTSHVRPTTNSPDLGGRNLHPTSPRELAAILDGQSPPLAEPLNGSGRDTPATDPADSSPPDIKTLPRTRLALTVLGPVELRYRRSHEPGSTQPDPTEEILTVPRLAGPARELLAYLAAHPDGATREAIIEAIWPRTTAGRPDTTFHTTISRLRKRIRDSTGDDQADPITVNNGRWRIDPATVTVDYWTLLQTSTPISDPTCQRQVYWSAVALYNGLFANDITGEWAHTIREATRRRYLETIADLSEIEIQHNPAAALDLLERARNMEPFNESIYRSIMRIQLSGRRYQSARNTYELLRIHLDEIDAVPDAETDRIASSVFRSA